MKIIYINLEDNFSQYKPFNNKLHKRIYDVIYTGMSVRDTHQNIIDNMFFQYTVKYYPNNKTLSQKYSRTIIQ